MADIEAGWDPQRDLQTIYLIQGYPLHMFSSADDAECAAARVQQAKIMDLMNRFASSWQSVVDVIERMSLSDFLVAPIMGYLERSSWTAADCERLQRLVDKCSHYPTEAEWNAIATTIGVSEQSCQAQYEQLKKGR